MKIDPLLSLAINIHSSKGVYALLLGSGASRAARIPTGWEVVLDLIRRLAKVQSAECEPDPAAWFKQAFGEDPDYSSLLDLLAPTPEQRQQILRHYFEPSDDEREQGLKRPTAGHRAIGRLVAGGYIRVILTTNFDRLIETAIQEEGVTPVVLSSVDDLTGAVPLVHQQCIVVKLHGDYLDTRIRNTPKELSSYDPDLDAWLDRIFDEFGLIVVGWSAEWDKALRRSIERCKTRRFGFWWASISAPRPVAQKLITARAGSALQITGADQFLEDLATKISVLDDVYLDHPASTAAAVALVKRYVANPPQQVRLEELLLKEADRAFVAVDHIHDIVRQNSGGPYNKIVSGYLAATATLRQMMATAAYWGGPPLVPVLSKCLMKLGQDRMIGRGGGIVLNAAFRLYPVMVALYAAGLGFVAADQFVAASQLLSTAQLHDCNGILRILVAFTHNMRDIDIITKSMPEVEKVYVPFSELLFSKLSPELQDLFAEPVEYERRFDDFELIMAMLYAEISNPTIPAKLEDIYLTPGRYVWKHFNLRLRSDLFWSQDQGDELAWSKKQKPFVSLIEAGFFQGDWSRLATFRHAAAVMAARWRFTR